MEEEQESQTGQIIIYITLILFVGFVVYLVGYVNPRNQEYWNQGSAQTCARVYDFIGKDSDANTTVLYEYYVDSVRYASSKEGYYFPDCEENKRCLGYRFVLRYALKKPQLNEPYLDASCD